MELRRDKESIPRFNKFLQGYYDASGVIKESFSKVIQEGGLSPVEGERELLQGPAGGELLQPVSEGLELVPAHAASPGRTHGAEGARALLHDAEVRLREGFHQADMLGAIENQVAIRVTQVLDIVLGEAPAALLLFRVPAQAGGGKPPSENG